MEEKMGKIIVDGKIIDLDSTPLEELKKLKKQLQEKEASLKKQIDKILAED